MTKLVVAFHNFANAPNNDHKTAALNGVRGTCLSFGIALSVPVGTVFVPVGKQKVSRQTFLRNLIYGCVPRVLKDQWKSYLWKPQLQMRICTIFPLTSFHRSFLAFEGFRRID